MALVVDPELKALIPPLTADERALLEESIVRDGCRDPLVVWGDVLVDGHNRLDICERNGIAYQTKEINFDSREAVRVWMRNNQMGRRNLTAAWRIDLQLANKEDLLRMGAEKLSEAGARGNETRWGNESPLSQNDKPDKHDTRAQIATAAGVSTGMVGMAEQVRKNDPELWEKAKRDEVSVSSAYTQMKKREKIAQLEDVRAKEAKAIEGVYDVIVIDPPWPMQKFERECRPNQVALDYPTMSEDDLRALSIPAAGDCHLWVWTTQKFLPMAFRLVEHWGFRYVCTFVWHKPGGIQPNNLPQFNCEFALYAHRGNPQFVDRKAFFTAFQAPRGKHSEKPQEFYDTVRRVTAGRRLDMFARRAIDGFDGWGNEL